jgi:hypothetical protein
LPKVRHQFCISAQRKVVKSQKNHEKLIDKFTNLVDRRSSCDADELRVGRSEAADEFAPFSPGKSDGIWYICFRGRSTFHNTPPWAVGCQSEENEESLLFLYSPGFRLLFAFFVKTILLPIAIGFLKN